MKKVWMVLLTLCLLLGLCGCKSEAAVAVDEQIAALGTVTLDSRRAVEEAEQAVRALTEKERGQLENLGTLTAARESWNGLVVSDMEGQIAALEPITADSIQAIEKVEKNFDGLPSGLQKKVSSRADLESARARWAAACAAPIEAQIEAIGTVTLDSREALLSARKAYEQAGIVVQDAVKNLAVLEQAEESYCRLKIIRAQELIDAIGEVTLDSAESIRKAADFLATIPSAQRQQVRSTQTLRDAQARLRTLQKEHEKQEKIEEAKSIFRITRLRTGSPDSVGGVPVYFEFVNKSDKTIKYVNFGVELYNAVGDVVRCEIAGDRVNHCYLTGPVAPGAAAGGDKYWGKYYNWSIKSAKLYSLDIEYMDGSTYYFDHDQIDALMP